MQFTAGLQQIAYRGTPFCSVDPSSMDKDPLPSSKPDPEKLGEYPSSEEVLDHAIEETFPASDSISIGHAYKSARKRERERRK